MGGVRTSGQWAQTTAAKLTSGQLVLDDACGEHVEAAGCIEASVAELCRAYRWRAPAELVAEGQRLLALIEDTVDAGDTRPAGRQRLLVASGWVWALLGCANYDAGRCAYAESCRDAVREMAEQTGHGELAGWAWEMLVWFGLADQRFAAALAAAQAGQTVAPTDTPVAARLALHEAKAAARLGDRGTCEAAIDRAWQVYDRLPRPLDEDHHFTIDETRLNAHIATAYLWLGDHILAEDLAWHVLTRILTPTGIPATRCGWPRLGSPWGCLRRGAATSSRRSTTG